MPLFFVQKIIYTCFVCDIMLIVNIYKTFDDFFTLPISLIQKRVIQILHVETNIFANASNISVENFDKTTQVTVIGNKKVYNLLSAVLHKRKIIENANKESKISHKCT